MKYLKIAAGVVLALILLFVAGGMLLPADTHVERSIVIKAEPAKVYSLVNDYREFNKWSPWAAYDPEGTSYEYTGPDTGVGARMSWASEHPNVGVGAQEIVESNPDKMVKSKLMFDGFDAPSYASFILEPTDGGTRVTWTFDSEMDSLLGRYLGLMMDGWVGADYERGLASLKELAES